jgi:hypothetical protein
LGGTGSLLISPLSVPFAPPRRVPRGDAAAVLFFAPVEPFALDAI